MRVRHCGGGVSGPLDSAIGDGPARVGPPAKWRVHLPGARVDDLAVDLRFRLFGLWLMVVLASAAPALGFGQVQEVPSAGGQDQGAGASEVPSLAEIQAQLAELEDTVEGQPDPQAPRRELLLELLAAREEEAEFQASAAQYRSSILEAPGLMKRLRASLASPAVEPLDGLGPDPSVEELKSASALALSSAETAAALAEEFGQEYERRKARIPAVSDEIAVVSQQVGQLKSQIETAADLEASTEIGKLQRWVREAQLSAARAHLDALEVEREALDFSKELLPLQEDAAQRGAVQSSAHGESLLVRATELQRAQADREVEEADRQLDRAQTLEPLKELAAELKELAIERAGPGALPGGSVGPGNSASRGLIERREDVDRDRRKVASDILELKRRFKKTRRRINKAGRSEGMGAILRREFEALPTLNDETKTLGEIRTDISDVQLLEIEYDERRDAAGDLNAEIERLSDALRGEIQADPGLEDVIREMLEERRRKLTELETDTAGLVTALGNLQEGVVERQFWVDAYRTYIRERILWVRSTTGGLLPPLDETVHALGWFTRADDWEAPMRGAGALPVSTRIRWFGVVLVCLLVWGFGRTARAKLEAAAEATRSYKTDSFQHTLRALAATVLLATRFPSIVLVAGLWMKWFIPQCLQARSMSAGLLAASVVMYVLRFVRAMSLPKGLGQAHFRWPQKTSEFVLRRIRHFSLPFAVCVTVVVALDHVDSSEVESAAHLGRVVFCIGMGMLGLLVFRLLHPTGPVIGEYKKRRPGWVFRSAAPAVHRIATGVPIALAIASLAGYYYTALRLAERFALSIAFAVLLVLAYGLLLRWLFLARRGLALEQARSRAAAKAEAAKAQGNEDFVPTPIDESELDLPAVNAQTQQLFRFAITCTALVALLGIWSDTLPALRIFERVQVWPRFELVEEGQRTDPIAELLDVGDAQVAAEQATTGAVSNESTGAAALPGMPLVRPGLLAASSSGAEEAQAPNLNELPERVTLADVGMAILILVLTLGAARNLPSFVEIVLLQRLDLDSGSRNAIGTLVRYAILILGSVLGFGAVGLSWGSIQWLAAALTFGLAFGLQEIFANFVSGLIILIERPVRVGDIVTVAGTEGQVTRLRMRATTILDYNRRELLVPNREFITGSLVNWTLSDPITREVIHVGVAYGSDVKLANELLLRAAKESRLVVDEPLPQAIFRSFGDSSLNFELRVYMANRELWARVVDDVHRRVDDLFREHDIEIAFPQRDLRVRSIGPLADALGPGGENPLGGSDPESPGGPEAPPKPLPG